MLDAHREQAVGMQLEGIAVTIQCADNDVFRPHHEFVEAWHGQAALAVLPRAALEHADFRVDEDQRLLAVLGDVHHDYASVHVDLRCRQPYAGCGVHGLEHVVDQLLYRRIDLIDRLGDGAQPGVGEFEDVEDGHECERVPVSCDACACLNRDAPHAVVFTPIVYPNDAAASVTPQAGLYAICPALTTLSPSRIPLEGKAMFARTRTIK